MARTGGNSANIGVVLLLLFALDGSLCFLGPGSSGILLRGKSASWAGTPVRLSGRSAHENRVVGRSRLALRGLTMQVENFGDSPNDVLKWMKEREVCTFP